MDLLEPNWSQERPSFSDVESMWKQLEITHESSDHPSITEVLEQLRTTHDNGGAEFGLFRLSEHDTFHWFGSRNRLDEVDFFKRFLSSDALISALPMLEINRTDTSDVDFQWGNSLTLDGEIAQALVDGGAYKKFSGTAREAKDLGSRFCYALFGDRFTEIQIYKTHKAWSRWFHSVAWDVTWLAIDKRFMKVWLLCVTDTD